MKTLRQWVGGEGERWGKEERQQHEREGGRRRRAQLELTGPTAKKTTQDSQSDGAPPKRFHDRPTPGTAPSLSLQAESRAAPRKSARHHEVHGLHARRERERERERC
ncbi:unnamed protein product [Prorocentrum cordatum]|uniref:Uncharacterized protein n=1 Tax=Prorocentrum cordatum TaxID=2364126 RepID=A0ABN9TIX8_9DINO|nr:unnamed protein product [Polarella glacialis]